MTVAPGGDRRRDVGSALSLVHPPGPVDRLLQRGADSGIEVVQRRPYDGGRHCQRVQVYAVELLGELDDCVAAAVPDALHDRTDDGERRVDVEARAGQHGARVVTTAPQVDAGEQAKLPVDRSVQGSQRRAAPTATTIPSTIRAASGHAVSTPSARTRKSISLMVEPLGVAPMARSAAVVACCSLR